MKSEKLSEVLKIVGEQLKTTPKDITNRELVEKFFGDIELFNAYTSLMLSASDVMNKNPEVAICGASSLVLSMVQVAYEKGQASVKEDKHGKAAD